MMLKLNRPTHLKFAARWVLALFVLSVLNMSVQMPLHAAMQQTQHKALNVEPLNEKNQASHCEMQASQPLATAPAETVNVLSDDNCCCPPALCDAVEAQQDKLSQQTASIQLFASLAFCPASFELQTDTAQTRGVVSLRYHDRHYRQISRPPLSLNTVLLI